MKSNNNDKKINIFTRSINQILKVCHFFFNKFKWIGFSKLLALTSLVVISSQINAQQAIQLSGDERGVRMGEQFRILYDPAKSYGLKEALAAQAEGKFEKLNTYGSTGLQPGAVWSSFTLQNTKPYPITVHIEYVDHQLIGLNVFENKRVDQYQQIADFRLDRPFAERDIQHNRFVFEVNLDANQQAKYLAKFSSDDKGYVFPDLRIWSPQSLRYAQTAEYSVSAFLFGGLFIMSAITLIGGIATGERFFFAYSAYSLSKIAAWATILGFTHQFLITDNFHWSYMSMTGAISICCAVIFARIFLQSKQFIPKIDILLKIMIANTLFLFFTGWFQLTSLAVISITIALLLYPVMGIAGLMRWYQGSKESGLFAIGWSILVLGLFVQALRDLGLVEHNFFYYYWPTVGSYTEMIVIMAAMGVKIRGLRRLKEEAEHRYTDELEHSKTRLEKLVTERTQDLEKAKFKAELEARTDSLTGTRNRRSFFADSEKILETKDSEDITFSLLMFDIDNFKNINDTYGHSVGDEALRHFAMAISKKIRDVDIFGRLGGEEFSLLLCGDDVDAVQTAERLREDISELKIDTPQGPLQFTTSIGVAHLKNETMIDELIQLADKALYEAKQKGRNRVVECSANSA